MKNSTIKIAYEPEADVLSWKLSKKAIDFAEEAGNMVIHFNKDREPVYVEILEASKFLIKAEKLVVKKDKKVSAVLTSAG